MTTVAIGDTFSLNGPKYPNPKSYKPETMKDVFMLAERNLAHALMTAVFCKKSPMVAAQFPLKRLMIGVSTHGFILGHSMPPTLPKSTKLNKHKKM